VVPVGIHRSPCLGTFDGVISISAIQWLAAGDPNEVPPHRGIGSPASHPPLTPSHIHVQARRKLFFFFSSLRRCLRRGARCALQFYPENTSEVELISAAAIQCGFTGGIVVDYPNSAKAKKFYLCAIADGEVDMDPLEYTWHSL
jgi:18S rRNA (guanine1575-N7)-methyltransferase